MQQTFKKRLGPAKRQENTGARAFARGHPYTAESTEPPQYLTAREKNSSLKNSALKRFEEENDNDDEGEGENLRELCRRGDSNP